MAPPPALRRHLNSRLFGTVAMGTLAGVAVFTLFYVIGAAVALAVIAVAGVALLAGMVWLSLRGRSQPARVRAQPPAPMP
jgi:hypothetical protein